jgi:hypothetical protein
MRPQLVVAGHPDNLGESFAKRSQHPFNIGGELAYVTR